MLSKARSGTIGTHTVVQDGDRIGAIYWNAADGTDFVNAAAITVDVDGTPASNNMPSKMLFKVNTGGAGPTTKLRVDADGLKFNSDTAATNALSDYEEGTFTPSFTTSGTDFTSLSYDSQEGTYTKVGNVCTVTITLDVNSGGSTLGSPTGTLRVAGLPFTAKNATEAYCCGVGDAYSFTGAREPNAIQTIPTASYAVLLLLPSGANADGCAATDLSTSSQLYMSLTYLTE